MNFLLIYLTDTCYMGDWCDFEPVKIELGERTSISGREIIDTVNKEVSGGFGVLGEFLFIEAVDASRDGSLRIWNTEKLQKTFPWDLLSKNVKDNIFRKSLKRSKCEDAPCCGCCDISDDGWNGYLN